MSRSYTIYLVALTCLVGCTPMVQKTDQVGMARLAEELRAVRTLGPLPTATMETPVLTTTKAPPWRPTSGPKQYYQPVEGRVAARLHERWGGLKLTGVLLRGAPGGEVRAFADGVVTYAYEQFRGLGHVIVMDCGSELRVVYAKQGENLVGRGDQVRGGQPIARLAKGANEPPLLYFKIFRRGAPTDPLTMLPRY